jgi:hypothetical protein
LVLSATLRLPLPHFPAGAGDEHSLQRARRELHWNPQRHLPAGAAEASAWAAEKRRWVERAPADPAGRRERFQVLQSLTERLRPFTVAAESQVSHRLAAVRSELQANAVLGRRDFAFCLFPEEQIRPFLAQFLRP